MTHHDYVTRLTRDGTPYLVCRVCGTTYPAETPLETVNASECVKVKRYDTPKHTNAPCDSRDKWMYQGDILIDAWRKERGEI